LTQKISRRQVLAGILLSSTSAFAGAALAGPPKTSSWPKPRSHKIRLDAAGSVDEISKASQLSGKVGFVVADAKTGEILESFNPTLSLPPASVAKTVTTLYGLEALGKTYTFRTQILATGPVQNGRLEGDLYLIGGGEPTLDTDALGTLAKQLKDAGLREISGQTYVYAKALPYQKSIDPAQPAYLGYNPSLSGINLNYNRVFFQWKRRSGGYDITMDARGRKFRPRVEMATMKVVERRSPVFTVTTSRNMDQWTVSKRALGRKGGRWLPVRRPDYYAGEVFQNIASSYGIVLPPFKIATKVPEGTVLASWSSKELQEVLRRMLKYSTNLTAEAVGVSASLKRGGNPQTLRASGKLMTNWMRATTGAKRANFVDHSGLEEGSRISPSDMVKVLSYSGWDGSLHRLVKKIKLHDAKGRPIKNSPIKVHAKTGTLNFVSALAGFI